MTKIDHIFVPNKETDEHWSRMHDIQEALEGNDVNKVEELIGMYPDDATAFQKNWLAKKLAK